MLINHILYKFTFLLNNCAIFVNFNIFAPSKPVPTSMFVRRSKPGNESYCYNFFLLFQRFLVPVGLEGQQFIQVPQDQNQVL
jgi:hypothetical protein